MPFLFIFSAGKDKGWSYKRLFKYSFPPLLRKPTEWPPCFVKDDAAFATNQ
jgi:hypothetical protein